MNTDIRINIEFWDHPKTVKMERRLGLQGVKSLQLLWFWAAKNAPDGDLSHLDDEDIEIAARWPGETGAFYLALSELRWLDFEDGKTTLHEWHIHNPWAAGAEERGDKARFSKLAQTFPALYSALKKEGVRSLSREDYERNVNEFLANRKRNASESQTERQRDANGTPAHELAPSPSPSPSPEDINTRPSQKDENLIFQGEPPAVSVPPRLAPVKDPDFAAKLDAAFEEFWEYYPKKQNRKQAREVFSRLLFPALGRDRLNARKHNIVAQAIRYSKENADTEPRYIKNPDNWLSSIDPDEEVFITVRYEREEEVV